MLPEIPEGSGGSWAGEGGGSQVRCHRGERPAKDDLSLTPQGSSGIEVTCQSLSPLEAREQDLHIPGSVSHQLRAATWLEGKPTLSGTSHSARWGKASPISGHGLLKTSLRGQLRERISPLTLGGRHTDVAEGAQGDWAEPVTSTSVCSRHSSYSVHGPFSLSLK